MKITKKDILIKDKSYRLVTRSDMDGLVTGSLLKRLGILKDVKFVHPKDMQDEKIEIFEDDIVTNLPYAKDAALVIDHHESEYERNNVDVRNYVIDPKAPSAARVVYDFFGGREVFGSHFDDIMIAVDKADSAKFTKEDILEPKGWELLSFLMDSRTGLGRFRSFRISNYNLMMELIDNALEYSIDEILELPDVKERVDLYNELHPKFLKQLEECTTIYDNVAVVDISKEEVIYPGNRFMIYAMYPDTNISIHKINGFRGMNTVFAVGKSIINRSSKVNIGEEMLKHSGGGHAAAGTCQVDNDKADLILKDIIARIRD